jgi:hypothetical protein
MGPSYTGRNQSASAGFVSSGGDDETKRKRDETIFSDRRRLLETGRGYQAANKTMGR